MTSFRPRAALAHQHVKACARALLRHIADCELCLEDMLEPGTSGPACRIAAALTEETRLAESRRDCLQLSAKAGED